MNKISESEQQLIATKLDKLACCKQVKTFIEHSINQYCRVELYKDINTKQLNGVHKILDRAQEIIEERPNLFK